MTATLQDVKTETPPAWGPPCAPWRHHVNDVNACDRAGDMSMCSLYLGGKFLLDWSTDNDDVDRGEIPAPRIIDNGETCDVDATEARELAERLMLASDVLDGVGDAAERLMGLATTV